MDLSIIILNYNTKDSTIQCLNSIVGQYKQEFEKKQFEIVLVDNASSDDSLEAIKKLKINGLKIIESKENLGFSKGCGLGAMHATGEFLLFLNSDTEIKDQGFVKMVDYLKKNEDVGILGAALRNEDGTSQSSAGKFYNFWAVFLMLLGFERLGFLRESPKVIKRVDWVSGAALMLKKSIFEKIGGFEKDLFMYMEDMELCFRAKKRGFKTYFYPEVTLFHKEGSSSSRTFAILNIYRGILFFYKKHKSKPEYLIVRFMLKSKAWILAKLGKLLKNEYLDKTYSEALNI